MSRSASTAEMASEHRLLRRMICTPLMALLRGKLGSDHEAVAQAIEHTELPESIQQLIERMTGKTRLWRGEKIEIALELAGHFRDGLDAGRSSDELIREFGDIDQAAQLVRRAKKRNRPLIWRASKRTAQSVGVLFLVVLTTYIAMSVRFFAGSPTVAHDYIEEINAVAVAVPEDERAWPIYRSAMADIRADDELKRLWNMPRGNEARQQMRERLLDHEHSLEQLRRAASMPKLGFVSTILLAPEDRAYFGFPDDEMEGPHLLLGLLLPHLAELRRAANMLEIEARWAMEQGDGGRVRENLSAMLGISVQVTEHPTLINELISYGILTQMLQLLGDVLAVQPELLSDDDLRRFAHEILARAGSAPLQLDLSGERMFFADVLQHLYTDDGRGSGRFTPDGARLLVQLDSVTEGVFEYTDGFQVLVHLAGPVLGALMADRHEMWRQYDEIMSMLEREMAMPLWRSTARSEEMIEELARGDWRTRIRYLPVLMLTPGVRRAGVNAEITTQRRDAMQTAIALEMFRRRYGDWPVTLDDLTPQLLPSVPVDRFDGQPLRYIVRDGSVVLYSIGANRTDNGGRPAIGRSGEPEADAAKRWIPADQIETRHDVPDGDWILWQSR